MKVHSVYGEYIPILRWKAAEVDALTNLGGDIKSQVMPYLELCPAMFHKRKKVSGEWIVETRPMETVFGKLDQLQNAIGRLPFYMDLIHVNDGQSPYTCRTLWTAITEYGKKIRLDLVPVTGFYGKGVNFQRLVGSVAREFGVGACVRLFQRDFSRPSFQNDLEKLLSILELNSSDIDLVVDLERVNDQSLQYAVIGQKLPFVGKWRSITFVGGSFPKDLSHPYKAHNTYKIPREEWMKWKSEYLNGDSRIGRNLRFGDFTVQHPLYFEPMPFSNVSASIRYTSDNYWVVHRGEALGKKGGMGSAQYPAEAQLIVASPEYSGTHFSFGDNFIMEKSKDDRHPGNPRQWLMVAINHHITYTVYQLHPEMLEKEKKEAVSDAEKEKQTITSLTTV